MMQNNPKPVTLIEHTGTVSPDIFRRMHRDFTNILDHLEFAISSQKKVFSIFDELLTNVQKHSWHEHDYEIEFRVELLEKSITVHSVNPVEPLQLVPLKKRVDALSQCDATHLKAGYFSTISNETPLGNGAGLGLITVFRKSSAVITSFSTTGKGVPIFFMQAVIHL
ncbi:MAG TPA: DUF6272 family protein [Bacteroidales bacterium]|nr:DUF6272 family protein [Bacteroidales bacterium]